MTSKMYGRSIRLRGGHSSLHFSNPSQPSFSLPSHLSYVPLSFLLLRVERGGARILAKSRKNRLVNTIKIS